MIKILLPLFLLLSSVIFADDKKVEKPEYGILVFSSKLSSISMKETWENEDVKSVLTKYKYIKWEVDSDERKDLTKSWRVSVFPTIIVVKKNENDKWKEITRMSGAMNAERLSAFLTREEENPAGTGVSLQN